MTVVLDAWAIVAWFNDEPAADRVAAEVRGAGRVIASWVNLGEVAYGRGRAIGLAEAQADLRRFATTITAELPDAQLASPPRASRPPAASPTPTHSPPPRRYATMHHY